MSYAIPVDPAALIGKVVGEKYLVESVCSNSGGMGALLNVSPISYRSEVPIVLKYCKSSVEEHVLRFKREVRLLVEFSGSSKVIQVFDHNLDHDPPFFVMPYCEGGDLASHADRLRQDLALQERVFLSMIDCISELHERGVFHRDIKPQNFLVTSGRVVVSDFGLCSEVGSGTAFTRSSVFWGTQGFLPPEFLEAGGFKSPSVVADIFMLGKTFYSILSGRDPSYMSKGLIPGPLFYVVENCCEMQSEKRIQSLSALKQSLVAAYDVLAGRMDGYSSAQQSISRVREEFFRENRFDIHELRNFVTKLSSCSESEREIVCRELTVQDFTLLMFDQLADVHGILLDAYEEMVDAVGYGWSFAERIASNMKVVFESQGADSRVRVRALGLAIRAATSQNRFAAMDTCREMISLELGEDLGFLVADLVSRMRETFIGDTPPMNVKDFQVRRVLKDIENSRLADF